MADIPASSWSQTDGSNTTAAPDGAPEGMPPSGVNDVMRMMMGAIKRWFAWTIPATTGGTTTAYTLSYSVAPAALVDGMTHVVLFNATNGAAPTLNINSLGAKPLYKYSGGTWGAVASGDITANTVCVVSYNSGEGSYRILASASTIGALLAANNLSDVASASTARTNLGIVNQSTTGPTYQVFTSGSAATYTTPANCKWIKVRMVGGGGGGGGVGLTTAPNGSTGGNTSFNSVVANGGAGGTGIYNSQADGGAGGTAGSGTATLRVSGQKGGPTIASTSLGVSGNGGSAPFFGGGAPGVTTLVGATTGGAGVTNTGGGGAGGGGTSGSSNGAGGGGSGEYVELVINGPSATYTYTVGAGGAGGIGTGTAAATGGAGAAGQIVVEEHYNY